jgi:hypothetical protein
MSQLVEGDFGFASPDSGKSGDSHEAAYRRKNHLFHIICCFTVYTYLYIDVQM